MAEILGDFGVLARDFTRFQAKVLTYKTCGRRDVYYSTMTPAGEQ